MKTATQNSSFKRYQGYQKISDKKRRKLTKGLVGAKQLSDDEAFYLNKLYFNSCRNVVYILIAFLIYYIIVTGFMAALWQPMLENTQTTAIAYIILFAITVIIYGTLIAIGTVKINKIKKQEAERARMEEEEAMRAGGSSIIGSHR